MKLVSGTTYSPPSLEALVTLSPSLLRKVSLVIRREGLLLGKWLVCYKVSLLVSFLETVTASMSHKVNERRGNMLISSKQRRCTFPGPSILDVPV